jgi:hypothetical protein
VLGGASVRQFSVKARKKSRWAKMPEITISLTRQERTSWRVNLGTCRNPCLTNFAGLRLKFEALEFGG